MTLKLEQHGFGGWGKRDHYSDCLKQRNKIRSGKEVSREIADVTAWISSSKKARFRGREGGSEGERMRGKREGKYKER